MTRNHASVFRTQLDQYGRWTRAALDRFLLSALPQSPLAALIRDYPERRGKMMRPALCLATALALGARRDTALRAAVAIELLHNALLIFDDIQDESLQRRGRPALHQLHGVPQALGAANALTLIALQPIVGAVTFDRAVSLQLIRETETTARESAEGQALELGWRHENRFDLTEADYLEMVLKKTCWFATIFPLRLGALISERAIDAHAMAHFGFCVGAAFQIQDDLLNLQGDAGRYGKELAGDLWEGKRTLMLIRLFRCSSPEDRRRLLAIYSVPRSQRDENAIRWVQRRMEAFECLEYARYSALGLVGAARHAFERCFGAIPPSPHKTFLEQVLVWVAQRDA